MNHSDTIQKLKRGWTLYNNGAGYWLRDGGLSEPFTREIFIRDRIVQDLERDNIIKLVIKSKSLVKAELKLS